MGAPRLCSSVPTEGSPPCWTTCTRGGQVHRPGRVAQVRTCSWGHHWGWGHCCLQIWTWSTNILINASNYYVNTLFTVFSSLFNHGLFDYGTNVSNNRKICLDQKK